MTHSNTAATHAGATAASDTFDSSTEVYLERDGNGGAEMPIIIPAFFEIEVRPSLIEDAHLFAEKRKSFHDGHRKPHEDRGSNAANLALDYIGVLAEIVTIDLLKRNSYNPTGYKFYCETKFTGPDFVLCGKSYDVKALPPGVRECRQNERQRLNPNHAVDYLLPVQFVTPTRVRLYKRVSMDDVAEWPLITPRTGKGSPFRTCPVALLTPFPATARWTP